MLGANSVTETGTNSDRIGHLASTLTLTFSHFWYFNTLEAKRACRIEGQLFITL